MAGCSGSGSSGSGGSTTPTNEAVAAIDATLPALTAELRAGTSPLATTATVGSVVNPLALPADSTQTVALGGRANDGTVTAAQVRTQGSRQASGRETLTLTVTDTTTQVVQLELTFEVTRAEPTFSVPPLGLSDLSADGTGQAFVLVRYTYDGTLRREFENDRGGRTLIDYGGFSPPIATVVQSATFSGYLEYWVEYQLDRATSGDLEARVVGFSPASSSLIFARAGGPGAGAVIQTFDDLTVDGLSALGAGAPTAVVGPDHGSGARASAGAQLVIEARHSGGVPGAVYRTRVTGALTPPLTDTNGFATLHTANLSGLTSVGDGRVQVDQTVRVRTQTDESPGSSPLDHALDGQLGPVSPVLAPWLAELEQVVYLANWARREQAVLLYR